MFTIEAGVDTGHDNSAPSLNEVLNMFGMNLGETVRQHVKQARSYMSMPSLLMTIPVISGFDINQGRTDAFAMNFGVKDNSANRFNELANYVNTQPTALTAGEKYLLNFAAYVSTPNQANYNLATYPDRTLMGRCFQADCYFTKIFTDPLAQIKNGGNLTIVENEGEAVMVAKSGNLGVVNSALSLVDFNFANSTIPAGSLFAIHYNQDRNVLADGLYTSKLENVACRYKRPTIFQCNPEDRESVWKHELSDIDFYDVYKDVRQPLRTMTIDEGKQVMQNLISHASSSQV